MVKKPDQIDQSGVNSALPSIGSTGERYRPDATARPDSSAVSTARSRRVLPLSPVQASTSPPTDGTAQQAGATTRRAVAPPTGTMPRCVFLAQLPRSWNIWLFQDQFWLLSYLKYKNLNIICLLHNVLSIYFKIFWLKWVIKVNIKKLNIKYLRTEETCQ
jgi:hypothetical protein